MRSDAHCDWKRKCGWNPFGGTLLLQTPPDPRTGETSIVLDPLSVDPPHHIPDPGQHTRRSYGAYSNRSRVTARVTQDFAGSTAQPPRADEDSEFTKDARRTWARLLAKIFEVDPMLCSCGGDEDCLRYY